MAAQMAVYMAEKHVSSSVTAGEGCRMRRVEDAVAPQRVMIAFKSFREKYHFFVCSHSLEENLEDEQKNHTI